MQCVQTITSTQLAKYAAKLYSNTESDAQPASKSISVTASDLGGGLVTIHGLRATDTLAMLRDRLATEMAAQPFLLKLNLGKRNFASCDYGKTVSELEIGDGA